MAIVVIGAGAIGILVAGRLAAAGEDVRLVARPSAIPALLQGVSIETSGGHVLQQNVSVVASASALQDVPVELAVVCVKGYDTASTLPTLMTLKPGVILTLQNGIGHEEMLAAHIGAARILSGSITTSVEVRAPGRIVVTKEGGIGLAALPDGPAPLPWLPRFTQAGFLARSYTDYRAMKWSKALLNMLGNASAAILNMSVAEVYADRRLRDLEVQMFREALMVMRRCQIGVVDLPRYPARSLTALMQYAPPVIRDPLLRRLIAGGRGGKAPSLQIELARGNPRSEGEFLYGAVAKTAIAHGVSAPLNQALWNVLRAIAVGEVPWESYRRQPERLLAAVGLGG